MKLKVLLLISLMLVLFVACSPTSQDTEEMPENDVAVEEETKEVMEEEKTDLDMGEEKEEMMIELTLEELKEFDGSNGDVIYVAVDNVIYDVSHLDLWKGGQHKGGITAGKDLTKEIKEMSPHGVGILKRATIVGKIVE